MTYPHYKTFCCACLLQLSMSVTASTAEKAVPPLPAWQVLEFEQRAFWATAQSRVTIDRTPGVEHQWDLSATSSVVGNSEQVVFSFAPASGQALKRSRLSRGKDQRLKSFDYQRDYVLRERRNPPADDPNSPPDNWPVTSSKEIPYPVPPDADSAITDSYALLLLADRLQAGPDESAEVVVHTDFNFYEVRMTRGNGIAIEANYQVEGAERVTGRFETRAVALQISPLGTPAEKPDFSLLGLHGEIILLFDKSSGLLLQVRGTAPRIGPTEINLKAVTLRDPAA